MATLEHARAMGRSAGALLAALKRCQGTGLAMRLNISTDDVARGLEGLEWVATSTPGGASQFSDGGAPAPPAPAGRTMAREREAYLLGLTPLGRDALANRREGA